MGEGVWGDELHLSDGHGDALLVEDGGDADYCEVVDEEVVGGVIDGYGVDLDYGAEEAAHEDGGVGLQDGEGK